MPHDGFEPGFQRLSDGDRRRRGVGRWRCGEHPDQWLFFLRRLDVQAGDDEALDAAFKANGFIREDRPGQLRFGYYHPRHLRFGFQQVSGALMDDRVDLTRLQKVQMTMASAVVLPPVEDLIADRLAQHSVASPTDISRLAQAQALFRLMETPDLTYLAKRVAEEGGDMAILAP